ncbi:MAG: M20/M25/M40 family metallo-hydrolase, partial [Planctomycetota bacterium]
GGDHGTFFQSFGFRPRGTSDNEEIVRNVIAILPGSDPDLKKEAVILGAHLDHVGREGQESNPGRIGRASADDLVWNGADDNASGTAGVIEIAQAFALSRLRPKRTLIFILFNAEEHGLFGSRHYVEHPVYPLEDTVAMINLDMIGRNTRQPVQVIGTDTSEDSAFRKLAETAAECVSDLRLNFDFPSMGGSDHAPFLEKRIPVAFFFTGLHRDYHHPGDEVDKIDCERVKKVSQTAFLMAYQLADQEERIRFNPDFRTTNAPLGKRKQLGIEMGKSVTLQEFEGLGLTGGQGAVRVKKVFNDSPASLAGLQEEDLILSIGTMQIMEQKPVTSLREAIQAAPLDADIPMEIVRNRKILMLCVRFHEDDS